jgi:competence protein ComEA
VSLFGKKNAFLLLIVVSAILLVTLVWQFIHGGDKAARMGFTPVNEQMEQLIAPSSEEAKAKNSESFNKPLQPSTSPAAKKDDNKTNVAAAKPSADPSAESQHTGVKSTEKSEEAQTAAKVELNTATLKQLDGLPGIGESKAKAILAYRQESGGFKTVEELAKVKGIGEKLLSKLKPLVYVEKP